MANTFPPCAGTVFAVCLPCLCHVFAMLPCSGHVVAMLLPCLCHVFAMSLPCRCPCCCPCRCHVCICHVFAMPSPCPCTCCVLAFFMPTFNSPSSAVRERRPVGLQAGPCPETMHARQPSKYTTSTPPACTPPACTRSTTCCGHPAFRHMCSVTVDTSLNGPAVLLKPK
jgi:hypothetical protein